MTKQPHNQSQDSTPIEADVARLRLEDIDGIGTIRAQELHEAGIETVEDFLCAPMSELIPPMSKGLVSHAAAEINARAHIASDLDAHVSELSGVGPQRASALTSAGYETIGDLRAATHEDLVRALARDKAVQLEQHLREEFPDLDEVRQRLSSEESADTEAEATGEVTESSDPDTATDVAEEASPLSDVHHRIISTRSRIQELAEAGHLELEDDLANSLDTLEALFDELATATEPEDPPTIEELLTGLRADVDRIDDRLASLTEQPVSIDGESFSLHEAIGQLIGRVDRLETALEGAALPTDESSSVEEAEDHTPTDATPADVADPDEGSVTEPLEDLPEHLRWMEKQIDDVEQTIDGLEKVIEYEFDWVFETVADLTVIVTRMSERLREEPEVLSGQQPSENLDGLTDRIGAIETRLADFEFDTVESDGDLRRDIDTLEETVARLKADVEGFTSQAERIDSIEADLAEEPSSGTVLIEGQEISTQEAIERLHQRVEESKGVAHDAKAANASLDAELDELSQEVGWLYRNTVEVNLMVDLLKSVRASFEQADHLDDSAVSTMDRITERIIEIRDSMERGDRDAVDGVDLDSLREQINSLSAGSNQ